MLYNNFSIVLYILQLCNKILKRLGLRSSFDPSLNLPLLYNTHIKPVLSDLIAKYHYLYDNFGY